MAFEPTGIQGRIWALLPLRGTVACLSLARATHIVYIDGGLLFVRAWSLPNNCVVRWLSSGLVKHAPAAVPSHIDYPTVVSSLSAGLLPPLGQPPPLRPSMRTLYFQVFQSIWKYSINSLNKSMRSPAHTIKFGAQRGAGSPVSYLICKWPRRRQKTSVKLFQCRKTSLSLQWGLPWILERKSSALNLLKWTLIIIYVAYILFHLQSPVLVSG